MDAWFWVHLYVVFRGLCQIFSDVLADATGTAAADKSVFIKMRMPTLTSLFKYVNRLRRHDIQHRRTLPRLVLEGTYYPPDAMVQPFVRVRGHSTRKDKVSMMEILANYPGFAAANTKNERSVAGTWMRIVALKLHCAHRQLVMEIHRLGLEKGFLLVVTITNDPFAETTLTTIGLDEDLDHEVRNAVTAKIGNGSRFVSF